MLWRSPDKAGWIEQFAKPVVNRSKKCIGFEHWDQLVVLTFRLDQPSGLLRVETDLFMHLLPVCTCLDHRNNNLFAREKRELFVEMFFHHLRIDDQAAKDILANEQNCVRCQKHFGNVDAPTGAVVEGPLQALVCLRHEGFHCKRNNMSSQGAHPLRAHWITFVRHGT